jgi:hypothetical protein
MPIKRKRPTKDILFNMRVTKEERRLIDKKAEKAGFYSASAYLIDLVKKDQGRKRGGTDELRTRKPASE